MEQTPKTVWYGCDYAACYVIYTGVTLDVFGDNYAAITVS